MTLTTTLAQALDNADRALDHADAHPWDAGLALTNARQALVYADRLHPVRTTDRVRLERLRSRYTQALADHGRRNPATTRAVRSNVPRRPVPRSRRTVDHDLEET